MNKHNLTLENIRDFKPGQSLYVAISEGAQRNTFLAEFRGFAKGRVSVKIVEATSNAVLYKHKIERGWEAEVMLRNAAVYGQAPGDSHPMYHWFDPTGVAVHPSPEEKFLRVPSEHPSYGVISISRVNSTDSHSLFGTSILQRHMISLVISRATLERNLSNDYIHGTEEIVEVAMSPQQFADMLTSMNNEGTPVTLLRVNGEPCGDTPYVGKIDQFHSEFEQKMSSIVHRMSEMVATSKTLLGGAKAPTKGERDHLIKLIGSIELELKNNLPYLAEQFSEQMGKTLGEAKAALSAYAQETAQRLHLPAGAMPAQAAMLDAPAIEATVVSE